MRIGLVWPAPERLVDISVRFERYVRGFQGLGHTVVTVCPASAAAGYPYPVHTIDTVAGMTEPELWRGLRLDVAVVIAWLGMPQLLEAMQAGSGRVVSISDSDGVVSARLHGMTLLRRMVAFHAGWRNRIRAAKHWMQLRAGGWKRAEQEIVRSCNAAELVSVTSPRAVENLAAMLTSHNRADLAERVVLVPYPLEEHFLTSAFLPAERRVDRVVAVGRWSDRQKDAPLLASGLAYAASRRESTEIAILGPGGHGAFGGLLRRHPRVTWLGPVPGESVRDLLSTSRVLVLSSRWESGPLVAFEALASGATVVGPRWVPACEWFEGQASGRVFQRRCGSSLGRTVLDELSSWDRGERDPHAIAARWRPRFDPVRVCAQLLEV